jgi:phage protein D
MSRAPSLALGALLGGLTSLPVIALFYLGKQAAGLPFVPFDLFEWLARVMPGGIITLFIDSMVRLITTLKLGEVLTVELGYGSTLTNVFQGYISNLTMEFGKMPSITVTALDARALMRMNVRELTYTEMKVSDVVTKVLGAYKKVCPKVTVTATTDQPAVILQNSSDYEFIKEDLCASSKSEFFILGDTAYFRAMRTPDTAIRTLEHDKGLVSFSCSITYCNEEIRIYGHDEKKNEDVEVKKDAKSETTASDAITAKPIKEFRISNVDDKTKAENIAEYELNELMKKNQTGRGACIGLPEIVPGRFLKIDKLDASVNKTYYIKQVTHSFGSGFTTEFEIGGWK